MNIYQKLVEVRRAVEYLQKEAKGQQYNYVSSSQVLASLRNKMNELGLLLIPRVTGHNIRESVIETFGKEDTEHPYKRTTTYFTELDMTMTWVNAEKPEETIECPWYGQGVDIAGEKGVGKALTYAEKYFLLKQFNIPTDKDDPDSFQGKHDNKPQPTTTTQQDEMKGFPSTLDGVKEIPPEPGQRTDYSGTPSELICSDCKTAITAAVDTYSKKHYGRSLCQKCQKKSVKLGAK